MPLRGPEAKLERLLHCMILVAYDYWIDIVPPQTDNIAFVASIYAQQGPRSDFFTKVVVRCEAVNRIHNSVNESQNLHPSVWAKIIRNADDSGDFSPIAIDSNDPYTIRLCYAVLVRFSSLLERMPRGCQLRMELPERFIQPFANIYSLT